MQTTMNLIAEAEQVKDLSAWAEDLGLTKRVLYTSKYREHLSPAIAGALAEKLGKNVEQWIVIAALESEKESTCKTNMLERLRRMTPFYWCNFAHLPRPSWRWMWSRKQDSETPSISASVLCLYQPDRHALTA